MATHRQKLIDEYERDHEATLGAANAINSMADSSANHIKDELARYRGQQPQKTNTTTTSTNEADHHETNHKH